MKSLLSSAAKTLLGGLLVVVPIYLVTLLLLKAMKSVGVVIRPLMRLLPDWFIGERILSLLLVLLVCFLIGAAVRTRPGQRAREWIEHSLLERIPFYGLFRSLTQQVAGDTHEKTWKPALAEIEEALVPAFIIEEFEDGRYTVFVPSIPTPLAGTVYILERRRVHPLDVPFTQALRVVTRWGSGAKGLDRAMEKSEDVRAPTH